MRPAEPAGAPCQHDTCSPVIGADASNNTRRRLADASVSSLGDAGAMLFWLVAVGLAPTGTGTAPLTLPVNLDQSAGSCQILDLVLGPLDLNLLATARTSPIKEDAWAA